jgi:hypothetical protein
MTDCEGDRYSSFVRVPHSSSNTYCNCLNCFVSASTWFSTHVFFAWTWRFPLWILVWIGSSCYLLLLVCTEQLWRKVIYPFIVIVLLYNSPKYYQNRVWIKKDIAQTRRGWNFFETQCIYSCNGLTANQWDRFTPKFGSYCGPWSQ